MSFYYEANIYLISVEWQFGWAALPVWAAWGGGAEGGGGKYSISKEYF